MGWGEREQMLTWIAESARGNNGKFTCMNIILQNLKINFNGLRWSRRNMVFLHAVSLSCTRGRSLISSLNEKHLPSSKALLFLYSLFGHFTEFLREKENYAEFIIRSDSSGISVSWIFIQYELTFARTNVSSVYNKDTNTYGLMLDEATDLTCIITTRLHEEDNVNLVTDCTQWVSGPSTTSISGPERKCRSDH